MESIKTLAVPVEKATFLSVLVGNRSKSLYQFEDWEDIMKEIDKSQCPTWAECIQPDQVTRVYLDYDGFVDVKEDVADNYKEAERFVREHRAKIAKCFGLVSERSIAVAVRHRRVHLIKEDVTKFKISAHFIITNLACRHEDIPKLLTTVGLVKNVDYDSGVYGTTQNLVCLKCCKGEVLESQNKSKRDVDKNVVFKPFVDCSKECMHNDMFFVQFFPPSTTLVTVENMKVLANPEKPVKVKTEQPKTKKEEPKKEEPKKKVEAPKQPEKVEANDPPLDVAGEISYEKLEAIVMGLSSDRADDYNDWVNVGIALVNVCDENSFSPKQQIELFHKFSEKSKKYDYDYCTEKFANIRKGKKSGSNSKVLTLGSIIFWLKTDNMDKYLELFPRPPKTFAFIDDDEETCIQETDKFDVTKMREKEDNILSAIDKTVANGGLHRHIAQICKLIIGYRVKFSKSIWFILDEKVGFWKVDNSYNGDLMNLIGEHVAVFFTKRASYWTRKAIDADDVEDRKIYQERAKQCREIFMKLNQSSFCKALLAHLSSLVYDDKFADRLDSVPNIIGFNDGVLDLNNFEFRKGRSEDMVTKSVGYNFKTRLDSEKVARLNQIYLEICGDNPELCDYVKSIYAKALTGLNNLQYFYMFTGIGSNGKSVIENFMQETFGGYAEQMSIGLFTKEGKGDGLVPELANKQGVRLTHSNEPNGGSKLLAGQIKHFTGGDKVTARGLFRDPVTFKPMFNIIILCNDNLDLDQPDNGLSRRFRSVPFQTIFAVDPKPGQKQADKDLMDLLNEHNDRNNEFKRANIEIMIELLRTGRVKDILENPPRSVVEHSKKYLEDSDQIGTFLRENYAISDDKSKYVGCDELYTDLTHWVKRENNRSNITKRAVSNKVTEIFKIASSVTTVFKKSKRVYRGLTKVLTTDDSDVEA